MVANTFAVTCESFCGFWNRLARLAMQRHGANFGTLSFVELRDDEIDEVMTNLRAHCATLDAAELFGPDDAGLMAAVGNGGIIKSGFRGSIPATPAEIRLAWILRNSERYVFERAEVCPAWLKPFPEGPVNSVVTLTTFLRAAVAGWTDSTQVGSEETIASTEQWRVLDNVQHTLAWLQRKKVISVVLEAPTGPRTKFAAGRYAAVLERWLDEQTQATVSPSEAHRQDGKDDEKCCSVVLRGPTECPLVLGREVPRLTQPRYDIIQALIAAGEKGLSLDQIKRFSGHDTAEKTLKGLSKNKKATEWKQVILLPGKPYCRYRLLFLSDTAKAG